MLEALVALSLAGNVIQLVQFSSDLLRQFVEIRRSGVPPPLLELKHITTSSLQQAQAIRAQLLPGFGQQLSGEDQALLNLVNDCLSVGNELANHVDGLLQPGSANNSRWHSLRQSVKVKFNQNKLDLFIQRLASLREALSFHVVLSLKSSMGRHHIATDTRLESIQRDMQLIILQLEEYQNLDDQRLSQTIQRCLESFWQEKVSAFSTAGLIHSNFNSTQSSQQRFYNGFSPAYDQPQSQKEEAILRALKFRQMTDRCEEISPAYQRTFGWIFRTPSPRCPWDSFIHYLKSNGPARPYWINGKAGSGKSTLMKYILDHPNTQKALQEWAGNQELIIASFFFWNLGTPLQKSHVGLLRSLLHTILKKRPELIQQVFSSLWNDWKASDENHDFSYTELTSAFTKLISAPSSRLKICIVVDGVDEFDGDHAELSLFLRNLSSMQLKSIISSRPIPACVTAFEGCANLRLQDLTEGDIDLFVQGNLNQHAKMVDLQCKHPKKAQELVNEIKDKAEGVFLWVKLVVKLLIEGMQNGDQISDLQRRLRSLPADLKDLYKRMLGKMDDLYQAQAAETFQMIRAWNSIRRNDPLTTLMLSYANAEIEPWIDLPPGPIEGLEALRICKTTESRVRSRCCGLVEVHQKFSKNPANSRAEHLQFGAIRDTSTLSSKDLPVLSSTIQYLHRSVAEFLYTKDTWEEICQLTSNSPFNANVYLTNATLFILKIQPPNFRSKTSVWRCVDQFTSYGRVTDAISDELYLHIMNTFNKTMKHFHDGYKNSNDYHWSFYMPLTTAARLGVSKSGTWLTEGHSLLTFAIRVGFHRYVSLEAQRETPGIESRSNQPLILYALDSWFNNEWKPPLHARVKTLESLMKHFTNLDATFEGKRYWEYAMGLVCDSTIRDCGELAKILVLSGAVPFSALQSNSSGYDWVTKLLLLSKQLREFAPKSKDKDAYPFRAEPEDLDLDQIHELGTELEKFVIEHRGPVMSGYERSPRPFQPFGQGQASAWHNTGFWPSQNLASPLFHWNTNPPIPPFYNDANRPLNQVYAYYPPPQSWTTTIPRQQYYGAPYTPAPRQFWTP